MKLFILLDLVLTSGVKGMSYQRREPVSKRPPEFGCYVLARDHLHQIVLVSKHQLSFEAIFQQSSSLVQFLHSFVPYPLPILHSSGLLNWPPAPVADYADSSKPSSSSGSVEIPIHPKEPWRNHH